MFESISFKCLIFLIVILLTFADEVNHRYAQGDTVHLYVHKVGPYVNPQEAYEYYALPYCKPVRGQPQTQYHNNSGHNISLWNKLRDNSIGEYLGGHALRHSGHTLIFASVSNTIESCTTEHPLTGDEAGLFLKAAREKWFYQMYLDDLPVWGKVAEMIMNEEDNNNINAGLEAYVYTERKLTIYYNTDRIIKIDLIFLPSSLVPIRTGKYLTFNTEIVWKTTSEEFETRFNRYLDQEFFSHQIHWFSLVNNSMMVLFLTGLVALILMRTLRKDYGKYGYGAVSSSVNVGGHPDLKEEIVAEVDEKIMDKDSTTDDNERGIKVGEDSGWRQVHGDVFRSPSLLPFLAAMLGSGWQLIILTLGVILFAVAGPLHGEMHEDRGEVQHAILYCYCLSSLVAGYVSGSYFKTYLHTTAARLYFRNEKTVNLLVSKSLEWQFVMFLTISLLPTVTVVILSVLNGIALFYGTINYVPFLVIFKIFLLWVFVSVPLCIFGTLMGRHSSKLTVISSKKTAFSSSSSYFPCRVNTIPRLIPEDVMWYGKSRNIIPFSGLLSFGSIFIELFYVLSSLWKYKIYHVYGFLLGVYAILILVVSLTTIIVVYFILNAENYHWQWTAYSSGASTGLYIFLYSIYFFLYKTNMTGFLQTMHYFGYMGLISLNLSILCGTIGHFAASKFVMAIFHNVKLD